MQLLKPALRWSLLALTLVVLSAWALSSSVWVSYWRSGPNGKIELGLQEGRFAWSFDELDIDFLHISGWYCFRTYDTPSFGWGSPVSWRSDDPRLHGGSVALWAAALPIGGATIRIWAGRVRERWSPRGRCGRCGYDLAGLASGARCPECGSS